MNICVRMGQWSFMASLPAGVRDLFQYTPKLIGAPDRGKDCLCFLNRQRSAAFAPKCTGEVDVAATGETKKPRRGAFLCGRYRTCAHVQKKCKGHRGHAMIAPWIFQSLTYSMRTSAPPG